PERHRLVASLRIGDRPPSFLGTRHRLTNDSLRPRVLVITDAGMVQQIRPVSSRVGVGLVGAPQRDAVADWLSRESFWGACRRAQDAGAPHAPAHYLERLPPATDTQRDGDAFGCLAPWRVSAPIQQDIAARFQSAVIALVDRSR